MRAVRVAREGGLSVEDVPVPEAGPGQVLVKVAGAGLCHSDVMISQSPLAYGSDGFTIGHETAGTVEALGLGATGLEVGEPVVVHAEWGCGACRTCRTEGERFCPEIKPAAGAGLGFDGGLAEYLLVPSPRVCVPLGDLDPRDAGPLDDAGLTPYSAVRAAQHRLHPGTVVAVLGIGGLGHLAVQILKAMAPSTVVAIEPNDARRKFAESLGADLALHPDDDVAAQITSIDARGATLVLDLVGSDGSLAQAATLVARGGETVLIGAALGSFPFSLISQAWGASVRTSYSGEVHELRELVTLAQQGKVVVHANHIALEDVPAAYETLDKGDQPAGRTIAVP